MARVLVNAILTWRLRPDTEDPRMGRPSAAIPGAESGQCKSVRSADRRTRPQVGLYRAGPVLRPQIRPHAERSVDKWNDGGVSPDQKGNL